MEPINTEYSFEYRGNQIWMIHCDTGYEIIAHLFDSDFINAVDAFVKELESEGMNYLDAEEEAYVWEEWIDWQHCERSMVIDRFFDTEKKIKNYSMNITSSFSEAENHWTTKRIVGQSDLMMTNIPITTVSTTPCHCHPVSNYLDYGTVTYAPDVNRKVGFRAEKYQTTKKEEGNNPMAYNHMTVETTSEASIQKGQRDYLLGALSELYYEKKETAREFFRIDPNRPKTIAEMIERLTSGAYTLKDEHKKKDMYYVNDYISWNDPKNPADVDGFDKAIEAMKKAKEKAERTIRIALPEEGLKALEAFESQTFH